MRLRIPMLGALMSVSFVSRCSLFSWRSHSMVSPRICAGVSPDFVIFSPHFFCYWRDPPRILSSILCCGGSVWLFVWLAFAVALVLLHSFAFIENPQPGKDMTLFWSFRNSWNFQPV